METNFIVDGDNVWIEDSKYNNITVPLKDILTFVEEFNKPPCKSCVGCKFLYSHGSGYSNWTWLETNVNCAMNRNKNLPQEEPSDWNKVNDNWPATNNSKCEFYSEGPYVELDVDGENGPADYTDDEAAIAAICAHSGRPRDGR